MINTHLKTYAPSAQLQSFIKCYYLVESDYSEYVQDVFYADGSVEIVFHVGLDFYRGEEKECWAKVIGQIIQPLIMRAKGKGKSFGIWFWPHTFSLFSDIPLNELNEKVISLDNVFNQRFIDFVRNCLCENDIETLIEGMNVYLHKKLRLSKKSMKEKIAAYAIQHILTEKSATDLDRLVRDSNISNRYLQKIFKEKIGFSPRLFIRVARFQYALQHLINRQNHSLTALAYQAGYYDQAHFIKEFKAFTGSVPSQFHLAKHPINQYFLNL